MEQNMNEPSRFPLSAAALLALAQLAALGDADRAAVLCLHGIAAEPRLRPSLDGTTVPTLRQLVPNHDRALIYGSSAWLATFRPKCFLLIYLLGCTALAYLGKALGLSLSKCGTTIPEHFGRRRASLGSGEYGAYHRGSGRYEHADGFELYAAPARFQLAPQHPLSPVRLSHDGILVGLPEGLSRNRFEAEFNRRLEPLRLHVVADSDAGRVLCERAGLDPAHLRRFTKAGTRFKAATELTVLRPQADSVALAQLAADIVVDAVLAFLPSRAPR